MPQSATPVDYLDPDPVKNKADLKSDVQDFIALPEARKIEIIKIGTSGYRAVLTADNPSLSPPDADA